MNNKTLFFIVLIVSLILNSISQLIPPEPIKIYSKEIFNIDCDEHFFYLTMNISSSEQIEDIITFELTLLSPQELKFKCLIDTIEEKLQCFSFVPLGQSYRKEDLFFHLFYYPPKIPGIEFDSNSFIKNSRKWENSMW